MDDKYENRPYHVAMFVSRNKDNRDVLGFKQRTETFLTQKTSEELHDRFIDFCEKGQEGEISRQYMSVNARKPEVIHQSLQHYLIDHPDTNLVNIEKLVASLAMKKGTALTRKFLFDYDSKDDIGQFLKDVEEICSPNIGGITVSTTPNGYAVVVEHGFDTRDLLRKWTNVELKRDAMLFYDSRKHESLKT